MRMILRAKIKKILATKTNGKVPWYAQGYIVCLWYGQPDPNLEPGGSRSPQHHRPLLPGFALPVPPPPGPPGAAWYLVQPNPTRFLVLNPNLTKFSTGLGCTSQTCTYFMNLIESYLSPMLGRALRVQNLLNLGEVDLAKWIKKRLLAAAAVTAQLGDTSL